jgi:adenine-specific DNA-methyltransferase
VDPTGTLLGNLPTFRALFCEDGDDRKLAAGQERELKDRLQPVLHRTLRRQAQEFLSQKFVDRHARLFEYTMTPEEHALYDDITRYLLDPGIVAFSGQQRRLLLIGFHRRMASSKRALSASLERVAARLRALLVGTHPDASEKDEDVEAFYGDLEEEDLEKLVDTGPPEAPNGASVRDELERVESFIARAGSLAADSKAQALLSAVNLVLSRAKGGDGSGKLVIFTESLATQDYLRELLLESQLVSDEEVTIFRGRNDSIRADQALARWTAEEAGRNGAQVRPSRDIAIRLALVHEFKTRSKIFISTEAGARGLNLQFCEIIVNYDLPWNPQRIEQRIGRCHRYGQKRDVTVINFLARDNEAQRLTFDILSQKLELFGTVLDASDQVLHRPREGAPETLAGALGAELESEMRRIYERARTVDEIEADLRKLEERMGAERERFEATQARMAGLMQAHLDEDVRRLFRRLQEELPPALAALDKDLDRLVCTYLDSLGVPFERTESSGYIQLRIPPATALPADLSGGTQVTIGPSREGAPALHLTHPLVVAALEAAQGGTNNLYRVTCSLSGDAPPELIRRRGARGRLALIKVRYEGFEPVEELLPVVLFENELSPLAKDLAQRLLWSELREVDALAPSALTNEDVEDAIEEMLFDSESRSVAAEGQRFDQAIAQIERSIDDRMLLLRRRREELSERLSAAEVRRDGALGPDARTEAEVRIRTLQGEIDEINERLDKLEQRDDAEFVRLRDRIHSRHFAPKQVERILDAELVIG